MRVRLLLLPVLLVAFSMGSASADPRGGNSSNAKLCQHGGWQALVRSDGTMFPNQGACVSFGAHGGILSLFTGCFVVDTDDPADYSTTSLTTVAAAAALGDTLSVEGVCVGSSTIAQSLTVEGEPASGYATPTLQGLPGPQPSGVLTVDAGAVVTIGGLTITGGETAAKGAGIDNLGSLTLSDALVTGNTGAAGVGPGLGSGIWNDGTLLLDNATVASNSDNQVGGGIMNESGTVTLDDSTISGNTTPGNGGGIENLGTLTLNGATVISDNTAYTGGGIDDTFATASAVTLNDTSSVSDNRARFGAGVYNAANGVGTIATVTLNGSSTISGNIADTTESFPGGYGGGIYNEANLGGTASVTLNATSSISENTAGPGAGDVAGFGGGIDNLPESPTSTATVTLNGGSLITHNTALHGGGIYSTPPGTLNNCIAGVNVLNNVPDDVE